MLLEDRVRLVPLSLVNEGQVLVGIIFSINWKTEIVTKQYVFVTTSTEPAQYLLDHLDFLLWEFELLGKVLHICGCIMQPHVLSLCPGHPAKNLQQMAGQPTTNHESGIATALTLCYQDRSINVAQKVEEAERL